MNNLRKKIKYKVRIENTVKTFIKGIFFLIIGFIVVALFGFVVRFLWNSLVPDIFGLKQISYLQSVGLLVLARILVGGFGSDNKNNDDKKEKGKKNLETTYNNFDYEKLYEKWWQEKGEESFKNYFESARERR